MVACWSLECVATPGSRRSCPGRARRPCSLPFSPALPVALAHLLAATETRLAVGQGQVRTVVPVPRGDQLPLRAARFFLVVRLTGGFCHADWTVPRQNVNSPFSPSRVCHPEASGRLHTRMFGTLASPPPPVTGMPWGSHLPGHQSSFCNRVMTSCSIHGKDELYSCKESLRHSSSLVEKSACGLRIARISPK